MKRDEPIKRLYELIPTNPVTDRIRKLYRDIVDLILSIHVSASISVLIVSTIVIIIASYSYYDKEFAENILVEAHGMLFDILVIGIFILSLNALAEKRIQKRFENRRYLDEIDDFRGWESKEAAHRIAGNLKRLKRNGYKGEVDLSKCYLGCVDLQKDGLLEYFSKHLAGINLVKGNLCNVKLQGADLREANLQDAKLMSADLHGAKLIVANLQGARLIKADLQGANLTHAVLDDADLRRTNLQGAVLEDAMLGNADLGRANLQGVNLAQAILEGVNLQDAILFGADLEGAVLQDAILFGADLQNTNLRIVKGFPLDQLSVVKSLYGATLDPELRIQVEEKFPHLLEEPGE